MTPMVNVGGEPFKIAAVAPWLGLRRAAGSVVIYQILHTLGMLLSFLTAVVLGALLLPRNPAILASLALAFVVLAGLVLLLLTGHRRGGLERVLALLHRIPLLDRLARGLESKRATLALMDEQITEFYHRRPRRFVQAVALEYLSRSIFMIEYVLIAMGVGLSITFAQAYVIGGLTSLVQNVIFVVPFGVGVDVDHAIKAPFYLRAIGLRDKRGYYWRSSLQEPVALLWIVPLCVFLGTVVPIVFFAIHVAMDYSVSFEKMPFYPYSPLVTRGWLASIPDKVKERILFALLLVANIAVYWSQHHV